MDEQKFSNELQEVLSYMVDVLDKEYPTILFSTEYILCAMLDCKKCHAYIMLNGSLLTSHIEELKTIYHNWLKNNSLPSIIKKKGGNIRFNGELQKIFDLAEKEKEGTKSAFIGTEHILLSMLNPENKINKVIEVFKNIGFDYNMFKRKCDGKESMIQPRKSDMKKVNPMIAFNMDGNKLLGNQSKGNYIEQFTINVNEIVRNDTYDSLIGREKEVKKVIQTLARRQKNNVVIVGKSGCGKTSIVYGIAELINKGEVPQILMNKEIVMLDMMALISGTHFRGMFEERINGLFNELKKNNNYILFIDDIHTVLKSTQKDKDQDISGFIGNILQGGEVSVIGTTSFKDYRNAIESNSSICRKLQKIIIEPASIEETIKIIKENKSYYENYHNVTYSDEVIKQIVELSNRFISERSLPDSAIDVLDLCGAQTCFFTKEPDNITEIRKKITEIKNKKDFYLGKGDFSKIDELEKEENSLKIELSEYNRNIEEYSKNYTTEITLENVASAISDMSGVPVNKLNLDEKKQIANLDKTLKKYVIGQDEAIDAISRVVKRNKVGLSNKEKTIANLLLLGQSGVGKCVCGDTKIKIKNKKTLEIEEITIEDFYKRIKNTKH